jgi:hypothetical protein
MPTIATDTSDKLRIFTLLFGEGPTHLDIKAIALLNTIDVGNLSIRPSVILGSIPWIEQNVRGDVIDDLAGKVDALQAIFGNL